MINNRCVSFFLRCALFNCVLAVLGIFRYATLVGSQSMFLSVGSIFGPMIGLYAGLPCAIVLHLGRILYKGLFISSAHLVNPLYFKLPTMFVAAYWARVSFVFRFLVPLVCIILFNLHPVGRQAFYYSLYWTIPLILYYAPQRNIIVQALASSFIAHGVGSVVWLYCLPMTSAQFAALMPIVLVERLVMALGMVGIDFVVSTGRGLFSKRVSGYKRVAV